MGILLKITGQLLARKFERERKTEKSTSTTRIWRMEEKVERRHKDGNQVLLVDGIRRKECMDCLPVGLGSDIELKILPEVKTDLVMIDDGFPTLP
jgi:hypothetical protein